MGRAVATENDYEINVVRAREFAGGMNDECGRTQQTKILVAGTRSENCVRDHPLTLYKDPRTGIRTRLLRNKKPGFIEPGSLRENVILRLLCAA